MRIASAQVWMFKSIEDSGPVSIDPSITVLVGQNESGKTAFLQSLHKVRPADKSIGFSVVEDYPRRSLNDYQRRHAKEPAVVVKLSYRVEPEDVQALNQLLEVQVVEQLSFNILHKYDDSESIELEIPERPYLDHLLAKSALPSELVSKLQECKNLLELLAALEGHDLNSEGKSFTEELKKKFKGTPKEWETKPLAHHVWKTFLQPKVPKFLYFDDYCLLPGKVNLPTLAQRVQLVQQGKHLLSSEDKTVLGLLNMAGVELSTLTNTSKYEEIKAKLEAISNSITDRVFEYWTQNKELDVEFDIRQDSTDVAPFNTGDNLYIRIRNRRHRVTVPFNQRSKGFIWFFSFLVWFDSIKQQSSMTGHLVLLLDEPGLNLHALAQADFLRYIDVLAGKHQILYTTHSPFMVHSDRLHQVRTVEDRDKGGTRISDNISGSNSSTLFPLQAALGYSLAQNLFISKRNLLVEGPADLLYLKAFSSMLEAAGRTGLRDDITVVPVGGLDKLATFVALLRGNELQMAVLHDFESRPDPRLQSLVQGRLIQDKNILHYGMFRDPSRGTAGKGASTTGAVSSDVEDLMSSSLYVHLFNSAFKVELGDKDVKEVDLPAGDRIVNRLGEYLQAQALQLRPNGGFNHYRVANHLASTLPTTKVDDATLRRFEALFQAVNRLFD